MKRRHFKLLMLILAALLPIEALAAETSVWDVKAGSAAGGCTFSAGWAVCYADLDAASESAPPIDTRLCENWSATWVSNIAATSHDNDITLRWSISDTASVNTSGIVDNKTLTGDPATSLDRLQGSDSIWLYPVVTTYTSGTGRLALHCFQRAE